MTDPVTSSAAKPTQHTIAIVVYCPTCDSFVKTAVQRGTVGTHGCMGCGGQMEVYVAHEYQALDVVVRRLYEALASAWDALGYSEDQRRKFFTHGMPQRERTSLIEVLPTADAEWVRNA